MLSSLREKGSDAPEQVAMDLSACLAKTYTKENVTVAGRTVFDHCCIVGEVARQMLSRLPEWLRGQLFPVGSELAAAAHDIGKVSPCFQGKIYRGIDRYRRNSIPEELRGVNPDLEENWGYHGGVSQVATEAMKAGAFIPEIVGQHHGYSPQLGGRVASDACFGGSLWQQQREKLVAALKAALKCDWPTVDNPIQAKVLSGLTTVSDWIGSSSWFEDPAQPWQPCIKQALDAAGFVRPEFKAGLTFSEVFPPYSPHKAQQKLIEQVTQPGVYVMEAPMGYGKTEAALYAAYRLMAADRATGFYFALPTQLTSDKVYDRVHSFLKNILADHCTHYRPLLLHSNAWLKETEMGEEGAPGGSWFQTGKRGILAPFAVGTIDQALMAVMNVKHGFVRAFGLAGKVVILDEVHSYDAYTGTLLNELIEVLKELQCTVIILSATLTQQRRYALLGQQPSKQYDPLPEKSYPLISARPLHQDLQEIDVAPPSAAEVRLHICREDSTAFEEALLRAEQGQQVLWIENTVAEAQDCYRLLSARATEINVDCGLLHSRFLKVDRMALEERWVNLYGKEGVAERHAKGRILIGTQLLEQSLDIDADFLVTRFCPTDMLLQRLGRLWRHYQIPRPKSAIQEAWILAPTLADAIENSKKAFGKTANIYSPYVLCRSLEVWQSRYFVTLPTEIRALIEATYADRGETEDVMVCYKDELEQKRETLRRFALIGLSPGGKTLPENKASTRYSEEETVEVFLLRSYHRENKSGTFVTLLSGEEIYLPYNGKAQDKADWRAKAAQLMQNTVRVAEYLAPDPVGFKYLDWLKDYFYLRYQEEEARLRVAVVHPSGELLSLQQGEASTKYDVCYDAQSGYQAVKK